MQYQYWGLKRYKKKNADAQAKAHRLEDVLKLYDPELNVYADHNGKRTIYHILMVTLQWALLHNGVIKENEEKT